MTINAYKCGVWGLALAVEILTSSVDVYLIVLNIEVCFSFKRRSRK